MDTLLPFELNDKSIKKLINEEDVNYLYNQSVLENFIKNDDYKLSKEIELSWDFNKMEDEIKKKISPHIFNWYIQDSTAGNSTLKSVDVFKNFELKPNYLNPDKSVSFRKNIKLYSKKLGISSFTVANPIFTCPYGAANVYSDMSDELYVASGSINSNISFSIPALTKYNIELIHNSVKPKLSNDVFTMYQIYLTDDNEINISIIERAKCAGVSILLLSIDAGSYHGGINMIKSSADITFSSKVLGNLLSDPVFNKKCYDKHKCIGTEDQHIIKKIRELLNDTNSNIELKYDHEISLNFAREIQIGGMSKQNNCKDEKDEKYTWSIYNIINIAHSEKKLSKYTLDNEVKSLPIIIKGILSVENAKDAIDADADGVYVSNHGGRFLYNSVIPLEVLPEIRKYVKSVNKDIGVWYDGGIRNGNEILMALAQGAEYIGIGRPIIYACVLMGQVGVSSIIKQLLFFLRQQCLLCGINNFEDHSLLSEIIKKSENIENKYLNKYLKYKKKYIEKSLNSETNIVNKLIGGNTVEGTDKVEESTDKVEESTDKVEERTDKVEESKDNLYDVDIKLFEKNHKNKLEKKDKVIKDSLGEMIVPFDKYWGATTARYIKYFKNYFHLIPSELIKSYAILKRCAAIVNYNENLINEYRRDLICKVCDEIISDKLNENFPLTIWQTGSGTTTNMNLNEVIANRANEITLNNNKKLTNETYIHQNDHVNKSQSSNDSYTSVLSIFFTLKTISKIQPLLQKLINVLDLKMNEFKNNLKIGRTHLQDAVPLTFGQEFSGYKSLIETNLNEILKSINFLYEIPIGGTAVGTELNALPEFGNDFCNELNNYVNQYINQNYEDYYKKNLLNEKLSEDFFINKINKVNFIAAPNKFSAISANNSLMIFSSTIKELSLNLYKIANDIRLMSSGPKAGIAEIIIPQNEPGSSIMPGKVNATQAEVIIMVCINIISNDLAVSICGSQGQFEMNVTRPLIFIKINEAIDNLLYFLNDFIDNLLIGVKINEDKVKYYLQNSLTVATILNNDIGYDNVSKIVHYALDNNISLEKACDHFGYIDLYKKKIEPLIK